MAVMGGGGGSGAGDRLGLLLLMLLPFALSFFSLPNNTYLRNVYFGQISLSVVFHFHHCTISIFSFSASLHLQRIPIRVSKFQVTEKCGT